MLLLHNKDQQSAPKLRNMLLQAKERTQAHHCITPEQWTWLLYSVSVISANKLSLQELNQLIGIKLLTSDVLEILVLSPNFQGGKCFSDFHYILKYIFGLNLKNINHFIWKRTQVKVWGQLPWSQYPNTTLNHDNVLMYYALENVFPLRHMFYLPASANAPQFYMSMFRLSSMYWN